MQSSICKSSSSNSSSTSHSSINKKLILLVFSFFLLVNIASSGAHIDWWDGTETFLVTESMVLKHSAKLYSDIPSVERLHFNVLYTLNTNKILQTGKNTNPLEPVYTLEISTSICNSCPVLLRSNRLLSLSCSCSWSFCKLVNYIVNFPSNILFFN